MDKVTQLLGGGPALLLGDGWHLDVLSHREQGLDEALLNPLSCPRPLAVGSTGVGRRGDCCSSGPSWPRLRPAAREQGAGARKVPSLLYTGPNPGAPPPVRRAQTARGPVRIRDPRRMAKVPPCVHGGRLSALRSAQEAPWPAFGAFARAAGGWPSPRGPTDADLAPKKNTLFSNTASYSCQINQHINNASRL